MERVFTWLADHLDDAIDLARLADVAALSPYHLHRICRAVLSGGCDRIAPRWS